MRAIVKWTSAEDARVRFLRDRGATVPEIAVALQRGFGSVKAHLADMFDAGTVKTKRLAAEQFDPDDKIAARKATMRHLKDILLVHGYGKRWQQHRIGHDWPAFYAPYVAPMSCVGSPAASCADLGGAP